MFGFGKAKEQKPQLETACYYEGEVICGDYDVNDPNSYPFHNLYPHGKGKITYTNVETGEIVENYEGEFEGGAYNGSGKLIHFGEIFEGQFAENKFLGK